MRGDFKANGQAWRRARTAIVRRVQAGERCGICGQAIDLRLRWPDPRSLTVDHIVPRSRGGAMYDPRNLQGAHARCNLDKSDGRHPEQQHRQSRDW